MADETYRPQKKSIDPKDISNVQGNQSKLNEMAKMREAVANEELGDFSGERTQQTNAPNPQMTPGMEVSGNIPPQMQAAMERARNTQAAPAQPQSQPPLQNRPRGAIMAGNSKLEEMLASISSDFEEIKLPSLGKFYNGTDGPADGILHVRAMTGEEEQILATPRFVQKGQTVNMIFNRCIQENYDSDNFLTIDRTYLIIYLRGISYSTAYDVEVKCPFTNNTFATTINLDTLELDYCPDELSEDTLTDTLPKTNWRFTYHFPRGKDERKINEHRERRAKNFDTAGQADDTLLYRTAILVDEINGLTGELEIETLLKKLPVQDVAYLRSVTNEPSFGVNTKVTIVSPFTSEDFEIELPLEANFFFPKIRKADQPA